MSIIQEIARRNSMWNQLIISNDSNHVDAATIREIGFFSGQAGIYRDISKTKSLTENSAGIAVSVLHTGRIYNDEYSDSELIYHYPSTDRTGITDQNEIQSVKNAGTLGVPIFVISLSGSKRKIQIGRVESWDDRSATFLISINPTNPLERTNERGADQKEFSSFNNEESHFQTQVRTRPGQPKFKFEVIKRYGPACAVCGNTINPLLQAAHIIPKKDKGSDDPRNGLVLCCNHHVAFDSRLFRIHPETLEIIPSTEFSLNALDIRFSSLQHLVHKPHPQALVWRWQQY